jgi:broad-specificity NMP kinase
MPHYIYINGYPGVGKFTVAKELEKLIPDSKVYHNHLLIDPIAALVGRNDPHYREMRTSLRRHILDLIATSESTQHTTWIFTDSQSSDPVGSATAQDYQTAAIKRGVPLVPVILHCELEENAKRVVHEGRGAGLNTKLTDLDILRAIRQQEDIHKFGGQEELEVDTTDISPAEAAEKILKHIREVIDTRGY